MTWNAEWVPDGWLTVGVAIALMVITRAFEISGPLAILRSATKTRLPEARLLGSNPEKIRNYLREHPPYPEPEERPFLWQLYRRTQALDIGFALTYGVGLTIVLSGTLGVVLDRPRLWFILWLPAALALSDIMEDLLILLSVRGKGRTAEVHSGGANAARWFTVLKWFLAVITGALSLTGAIWLGIDRSVP
jgi:hypothetical protein